MHTVEAITLFACKLPLAQYLKIYIRDTTNMVKYGADCRFIMLHLSKSEHGKLKYNRYIGISKRAVQKTN